MEQVFGLIAPLFGLIFLGYLTARLNPQPLEALGWLNTFILYLALPALFIKIMAATPVEDLTNGRFIFASLGATLLVMLVGLGLGLLFTRGNVGEATIQALASGYGNIGYMGPAIAILVLGEAAAAPVALIVCFENIMHFAFAPTMMALAGREARDGGGLSAALGLLWRILLKVALHPLILAALAGVALAVLKPPMPEAADSLISYLAQAAAPCALFAMGVTLALRPLRRAPPALLFIAPLKLAAHPLLVFFALTAVGGVDPVWVQAAVLLAALPTATNVFVMASQYGVWVENASASVLTTTALSVFTVSVAILWAQGAIQF